MKTQSRIKAIMIIAVSFALIFTNASFAEMPIESESSYDLREGRAEKFIKSFYELKDLGVKSKDSDLNKKTIGENIDSNLSMVVDQMVELENFNNEINNNTIKDSYSIEVIPLGSKSDKLLEFQVITKWRIDETGDSKEDYTTISEVVCISFDKNLKVKEFYSKYDSLTLGTIFSVLARDCAKYEGLERELSIYREKYKKEFEGSRSMRMKDIEE